jgi:transglutaminase superfamily protein
MPKRFAWFLALGLVAGPVNGALTRDTIERAAGAAGFRVKAVQMNVPRAVRPRLPFVPFDFDDPLLEGLRREHRLSEVTGDSRDEWARQLKLKDWIFRQIPGGNPRHSPRNALEVLRLAAKGEKFYCTQYAITYVECAQALGWPARKIGVDRRHGSKGLGSSHHGVAEVWSNQFQKWVVMDAQSNLHFEKKGVPLSAWELRSEWLKNKGAEVDHMVGCPPDAVKKNPAMVWKVPDEDEIATYFWLYIEDHANTGEQAGRQILPLDKDNLDEVWYQNDYEAGESRIHVGYTSGRFLPTMRLDDAYWTVGIVEAEVAGVEPGVIQMRLNSYCPNRTAYEICRDGREWERVTGGDAVEWKLKEGWNTFRARTVSRGEVRGPEAAVVITLEK